MFFLLYKFFKESILLADYILYFYFSNIVVITFLQFLLFIFIYNFFNQFKIIIRESVRYYLMENNINLIKSLLITYHQEQINFITKLFDNKIVQQLFPNIVFSKTNKNVELPSKVTTNFKQINEKNIKYPKLPESPKEINTKEINT